MRVIARMLIPALTAVGLLALADQVQAQVRGGPTQGGFGGQSLGGQSFGGQSFGGSTLSGGISGGFRPSGTSATLNRGTGFIGSQGGNPFANIMGSPYGAGVTGGISGGTFGGNYGMSGGFGGNRGFLGGGQFAGMSGMNNRFGMGGGIKLATATMTAALKPIPPAATDVLPRISKILDDTSPNSQRDIQMEMEGSVLVLKGSVGSEREKQLAESMLRLEPGVYDIRNDLEVKRAPAAVKNPPPPPKPRP